MQADPPIDLSAEEYARVVTQISELHRKRGEDWVQRDADAYLSYYWDDALLFLVERRTTVAEMRQSYVALLAAGGGPLSIDLPDVDDIMISDESDAATTSFEWRATTRSEDGTDTERSYFETDVWFQRSGVWRIVRMHLTRLSLRPISPS